MKVVPTTIATPEKAINREHIRSMSLDTLYSVSQALAVFFGVVALLSGMKVNKRQAKQLVRLETTLQEQRQKTEGLHQANIEAQSALEKERGARVEMEKSLAVRSIVIDFNKGQSNVDALKPFAGIQFILRSLPDPEPARAAISLTEVLQFAGWVRAGREISAEYSSPTYDGVTISTIVGTKDTGSENAAARALMELLETKGWEVRRGAPVVETPNTIQITIGFKPPPYFLNKETKDLMEKVQRAEKEARGAESQP